jgi:hypothetical protein
MNDLRMKKPVCSRNGGPLGLLTILLLFILPDGLPVLTTDCSGAGLGDVAVFRPGSGLWSVRWCTRFYFGALGDSPLVGDFDGDRIDDLAIFRPPAGLWAIRNITRIYFGTTGDRAAVADYDGDGTSDPAVYRGTLGLWAIRG